MKDIKIKQTKKGTIKRLDKSITGTQKIKDNIVSVKNRTNESANNEFNSETEYATNKITNTIQNAPFQAKRINNYGKDNYRITKENVITAKHKIDSYKNKFKNEEIKKRTTKIGKDITKTGKNVKKSTIKTADNTIKTTKETVKITKTMAQKSAQIIKTTVKASVKTIKTAGKATISAIKGIIAGTKALIAAIIAGGWIAIIVLVIICLIGMICSSCFGIFFAGQDKKEGSKTITSVVSEINKEFTSRITDIQNNTPHDEFDINSNRAEWKTVLAVYAVKVNDDNGNNEVITLTDEKIQKLKDIFWDMHEISSSTEEIEKEITTYDDEGNKKQEKVKHTVLHINITSKTANEMAEKYNFSKLKKDQLQEMLSDEYAKLWKSVIYGTSKGDGNIVATALSQLGNVNGEIYWSWYGFKSRVEWCACFVSWCAEQCGYINAGIIPKFAGCQYEGVEWFKTCGLWKDGGYSPQMGDIIFFDWKDKETGLRDNVSDHVGIVEYVEENIVHTVEGNSNNSCKQREYDINSLDILGYGTPAY